MARGIVPIGRREAGHAPMILARWAPVTVLRGYHEARMHELTEEDRMRPTEPRPASARVASWDGITPVGHSVKHDADGEGAAL